MNSKISEKEKKEKNYITTDAVGDETMKSVIIETKIMECNVLLQNEKNKSTVADD